MFEFEEGIIGVLKGSQIHRTDINIIKNSVICFIIVEDSS
jgi:hypothetical protein